MLFLVLGWMFGLGLRTCGAVGLTDDGTFDVADLDAAGAT